MSYKSTNNQVLFDCLKDLIKRAPSHKATDNVSYYMVHFKEYNGNDTPGFNHSLDNWIAIYAWVKTFLPSHLSRLPLFGHHSLRPDNFIFFLRVKHPKLFFVWMPLWFIPMLAMWATALRQHGEDRHGSYEYRTSGVQLAWLKLQAIDSPITKRVMDYLVNKLRGGYKKTLLYYHKDNEEINRLRRFLISKNRLSAFSNICN